MGDTEGDRGSGALPLFMIGLATATAAEIVLGLLVYTAPGLLTAITVIVSVEMAALTAGVATRPPAGRYGGRWRWFVALGAFLIAGFGSLAWSFQADFMATWTTRGLSLGVMAAMPMYACGLLISAIPRPEGRGAGPPVLAGATAGVVLFGFLLFPRLQPFGIYLFGVLCISIAAFMTAGRIAVEARRAHRRLMAEQERASTGDERVEDATAARLVVTPSFEEPGDRILTPADLAP